MSISINNKCNTRLIDKSGFSLIELMISLVAGFAVIFVIFSGYRTASKTFSTATKLQDEISLIAAGMNSASEEIDTWKAYDNEAIGGYRVKLRDTYTLPKGQPLVTTPIDTNGNVVKAGSSPDHVKFGLPFSKLSETWGPNQVGQNYGGRSSASSSAWVGDQDGEDKVWAISAANPLTWWTAYAAPGLGFHDPTPSQANGLNKVTNKINGAGVLRRGYPGINGMSVGNSSSTFADDRKKYSAIGVSIFNLGSSIYFPTSKDGGIPYTIPYYGIVEFKNPSNSPIPTTAKNEMANGRMTYIRGWLFNQMRGLQTALGFYGMMDYLPAGVYPVYLVGDTPSDSKWQVETRPNVPQIRKRYPKNISLSDSVSDVDWVDWEGFPMSLTYGYLSTRQESMLGSVSFYNFRFSLNINPVSNHSIPSSNMLLYPAGFSIIPWCNEGDIFGYGAPGVASPLINSTRSLVYYHRNYFALGESEQVLAPWLGAGSATILSECDPMDSEPSREGSFRTMYDKANLDPAIGTPVFYSVNGKFSVLAKSDKYMVQRYLMRTTGTQRLLGYRPSRWPEVSFSVSHHLRQNRHLNLVKVSFFEAESGKNFDLRFSATGTTLRGARRQRGLDQ